MNGKQIFYCPKCDAEIEEEEVDGLMIHKLVKG